MLKYNIKENRLNVDIKRKEWKGMDWIYLAQNRDLYKHGNEPSDCIKCWKFSSYG
jgi:hypothetical protein